ncbi:hypothetical protein FBALC1_13657 [Flavobacteriales bacterium ALC-1]|nr:hypothetical protein FBALC1_13657 [Flavobacteriales bacterium ALC-1]
MKRLYDINKWLIISTLLLYLTFWGGILAHLLLGIIQIIMSISIMLHFSKQTYTVKQLFITYLVATVVIVSIFKIIKETNGEDLQLIFMWMITTMFLALFHLYITYKIKQS